MNILYKLIILLQNINSYKLTVNYYLGNTSSLPFKIERTNTGQLPVYSDIRNGRTNILTIVRRCSGDLAVSFIVADLALDMDPATFLIFGDCVRANNTSL